CSAASDHAAVPKNRFGSDKAFIYGNHLNAVSRLEDSELHWRVSRQLPRENRACFQNCQRLAFPRASQIERTRQMRYRRSGSRMRQRANKQQKTCQFVLSMPAGRTNFQTRWYSGLREHESSDIAVELRKTMPKSAAVCQLAWHETSARLLPCHSISVCTMV